MISNYTLSNVIVFILGSLWLTACGLFAPTIRYIGESYPASGAIDFYYDEREVKQAYKVMGKMTNDLDTDYKAEEIKKKMIEKATEVGADGIIFLDISESNEGSNLSIKAELIKYQ